MGDTKSNPFSSPDAMPPWLQESQTTQPEVVQHIATSQQQAWSPPAPEFVPPSDKVPGKVEWTSRGLHVLTAFMLSLCAVLALIGVDDASTFFVALYIFFFALMICGFEIRLKALVQVMAGNCGFIQHSAGRVIFLLMVGVMSLGLGGTWGYVAASFAFIASVVDAYIGVAYNTCFDRESDEQVPSQLPQNSYHPPVFPNQQATASSPSSGPDWVTASGTDV